MVGDPDRPTHGRARRAPDLARRTALAATARRLAAVTFAVVSVALASDARAELELDGKWRQGPLREDYTVQQWLSGCGPTPQSASAGGGELVTIKKEGDELAIIGGGRVYRTNQCYEVMPTLIRETHSRDASGKAWRTRCVTPAGDPRRALLQTLVVATTDRHIDIIETGRYEISLAEGRCVADVKRTRGFDLVVEKPAASASAAPPPPTVEKPAPPPPVCATVGEPARLEVRPSRKLLRSGEKFPFRAAVVDEKGCATGGAVTFRVANGAEGRGVTVDGSGVVTVAAGAPEGTVDIVATSSGKSATVSVEVSDPAHYDDLLQRSGLNAQGENDSAAIAIISSQSLGGGDARGEDGAKGRRLVFLGIVGAGLVVLLIVGVVVLRRSRRAAALEREVEERHTQRMHEAQARMEEKRRAHAEQQRAHAESVERRRQAEEEAKRKRSAARPAPAPTQAEPPMTCPTCNREWPPGTLFCPMDATKLVAGGAGALPGAAAVVSQKRGKICPTCGDRFDGTTDFCGKDGTALVMLN